MKKVRLIYLSILLFIVPTTAFAQYNVGNDDGFSVSCVGSVTAVPLPIKLILFEAECVQNKVLLKWATASEINNDYFTIERSLDAMYFEIVGIMQGAGNSSQLLTYLFTDGEPYNGISYYRLMQTDFDGRFEYFNIISVNCTDNKIGVINVYPNPFSNELTIEITGNNDVVNFEIIDAQGSLIYKGKLIEKTTVQTSSFASGVYLIKLENGSTFEFKKVIKE